MRHAVVHKRIDFIRFVKDGVHPELRATHADIGGGVVAEDDHFLPGAALAACFQHPQAAVAPGQAAVFYRDELVVGGGTITAAV